MEKFLYNCIQRITEKSKIKGVEGHYDIAPRNPSIVVNYNLDNKQFESYLKHMEQLWPKVYWNLRYAEHDMNMQEIENDVRTNQMFDNFNEIHIHILYNATQTEPAKLFEYIRKNFNSAEFKVIIHAWLDYSLKKEVLENETRVLQLMKEKDINSKYLFVYSNRLNNGGLWIREDAVKLMRLMANITSIMMSDGSYFTNGCCYTFSYNILEKPTKKIVQFSTCRLLRKLTEYKYIGDLPKKVEKKFYPILRKTAENKLHKYRFDEEKFYYLPSNKDMAKENKSTIKSIRAFRAHYPTAAECFEAILSEIIDEVNNIDLTDIDFTEEINEILPYYYIKGYLDHAHKAEELYAGLEGVFLHKAEVTTADNYYKFLNDYANQKLLNVINSRIFAVFRNQITKKIENTEVLSENLEKIQGASQLLINALDKEINLESYYSKIADDYFSLNHERIIFEIDKSLDCEDLIDRLEKVMMELYTSKDVFYMSFEDEIDERVGKNTAKSMFEAINQEDNVKNNICFNAKDLQYIVEIIKTNDVILLLNPQSNLINHKITENYHKMELSRQDCVERIDFHTLIYKGGEE